MVEEAWAAWREEIAFSEQFTRGHDLGFAGRDSAGEPVSLRVHMIEEYASHNGHADLLRERIDGRVGSRMLTVLRSGDDSVLEWCLVGGAGVPSRSRLPRGQPNRPACGQPV